MNTRKIFVNVTTEDGTLIDRVEIELAENEDRIAITPIHQDRFNPGSAAEIIKIPSPLP